MGFLDQPITLQTLFGTKRTIGPITVQLIVSEDTVDTLTITKQPVQTGTPITDHSYKEPAVLSMVIRQQPGIIEGIVNTFTGGGLAQIYKDFLDLQNLRQPFIVTTPKRVYRDMLMAVLRQTTDKTTETILSLSVTFQEVVFASVGTTLVPPSRQKHPRQTQGTQNTGKQSSIVTFAQGVKGLRP